MNRQMAVDEVAAGLRVLGLDVEREAAVGDTAQARADLVAQFEDRRMVIEVKARSRVRLSDALLQLRELGEAAAGGATQVVVAADRIDAKAAAELISAGVGLWDRSTRRLVLRAPGVRIDSVIDDADVASRVAPPGGVPALRTAFTGIGLRVAYWLLTHPGQALGVRAVATEIDASPTQVSAVAKALRNGHLLDQQRRVPDLPALFWELAEHWTPVWSRDLVSAERAVLEDGAVVGTLAALAYGAPAVVGVAAPSVYVPSSVFIPPPTTPDPDASGVRTAASPAPQAAEPWGPLISLPGGAAGRAAHPVAVALDLAADRGRGRQILADWKLDPDTADGARRVW